VDDDSRGVENETRYSDSLQSLSQGEPFASQAGFVQLDSEQ
jgi:hypothetical protein